MPDDQVECLVYMMTSEIMKTKRLNSREFNAALSNQNYTARERSFYSNYDGYIFGNWVSLVKHSLRSDS
jgi:hypothetical protein